MWQLQWRLSDCLCPVHRHLLACGINSGGRGVLHSNNEAAFGRMALISTTIFQFFFFFTGPIIVDLRTNNIIPIGIRLHNKLKYSVSHLTDSSRNFIRFYYTNYMNIKYTNYSLPTFKQKKKHLLWWEHWIHSLHFNPSFKPVLYLIILFL